MQKIIAILDDEQEMGEIYHLLLEKEIVEKKIHFYFFSDSRLFARWIEGNRPDVVLTDLNMPFLTGQEVIRLVRNKYSTAKTYIISGDVEDEHQKVMKELGVSSFLSKPINFQSFQGTLNLT